jgi:hypothetical protein
MATTQKTTDVDVIANIKLEKFAIWTWNQAWFFSKLYNYKPHPRKPKLAKVGP